MAPKSVTTRLQDELHIVYAIIKHKKLFVKKKTEGFKKFALIFDGIFDGAKKVVTDIKEYDIL